MPDEELDDRNDEAKTTYDPYESGAARDTAITWDDFFMKLAYKSTERPGIDRRPENIVKNKYNIDTYFIQFYYSKEHV